VEGGKGPRVTEKNQPEQHRPGHLPHGAGNAAQQARQRKGAKTRGPLLFLLIAAVPAALQAHKQTDGKRNGKTAGQTVHHS